VNYKMYLKPSEAAEYVGSSTSTLSKLRLSGAGPTFLRIGRAIRYRQSDLDRWMDRSATKRAATRTARG
jgi:excisionase family DNA binding protein